MHLRSEEVLPPSSTRVNPNREPISNKDCMVLIGPASLFSLLKAIYQLGETIRQMGSAQSFATENTHRNHPSLNTHITHSDNQERGEIPTSLEEVDLEDISIHFLCTYSTHPNWKQIVSTRNDYGQTLAHISVTLGYFRLLQHLFGWKIDLNVADSMGLTALHYAYLFKQEECAKLLIQSGVDQFILDDLGRSPSDLDPPLEGRLRSIMENDNASSGDGASSNEYDTEMPDEAGKLFAKHFLIQQWMRQGEDERKSEEPISRCQSQEIGELKELKKTSNESNWKYTQDIQSPSSLQATISKPRRNLPSEGGDRDIQSSPMDPDAVALDNDGKCEVTDHPYVIEPKREDTPYPTIVSGDALDERFGITQ